MLKPSRRFLTRRVRWDSHGPAKHSSLPLLRATAVLIISLFEKHRCHMTLFPGQQVFSEFSNASTSNVRV